MALTGHRRAATAGGMTQNDETRNSSPAEQGGHRQDREAGSLSTAEQTGPFSRGQEIGHAAPETPLESRAASGTGRNSGSRFPVLSQASERRAGKRPKM